jgi:3-isopropylmalate/(R)-2-methylmalate dehydratase small subunit
MSNEPLITVQGIAAPILRSNIDTDAIAPSRVRVTSLAKSGYAKALFANWRFDEHGNEIEDFVLNQEPYRSARILVAGPNFGCGSSRETAVWALQQSGFRTVIAPSFGSIFESNCYRNGLLPLSLPADEHDELVNEIFNAQPEPTVEVDLQRLEVKATQGQVHRFSVDKRGRHLLLQGLDTIGETLLNVHQIEQFRNRDRAQRPWVYTTSDSRSEAPSAV